MMTKQEERAALAKIEKIIKAAGPDSYIGMAFAGCCEIAADNIENDFGESMQARVAAREKELREVKEMLYREQKDNELLRAANKKRHDELDELRDQLKAERAKQLPHDLYREVYMLVAAEEDAALEHMEKITECLCYCSPENEADQESITHLLSELRSERIRRDNAKRLIDRLTPFEPEEG